MVFRPHDLLWVSDNVDFCGLAPWVKTNWSFTVPVVVRRDTHPQGFIPVGIRGDTRDRRAAGWVAPHQIVRCVTPEQLANPAHIAASPFAAMAPMKAALMLTRTAWPWSWGITGSGGFALATGRAVLHPDSDLDLVIYAPSPLPRETLIYWQQALRQLPCRADTQVETPWGAFALNEWLRDGRVLLKTNTGPCQTDNPWQEGEITQ